MRRDTLHNLFTFALIAVCTIFLSFADTRAEQPLSDDAMRLKEQIKREILDELKGGPDANTKTAGVGETPLSEDDSRLKEQIKKELLQELKAEGYGPKAKKQDEKTSEEAVPIPQEEEGKDLKTQMRDEVLESLGEKHPMLGKLLDHFTLGLLLEFGGVWEDVKKNDGSNEDRSSFAMTTVELALGFSLTDWINSEAVFLFEDPTFDEETSLTVDVATITIGNTEKFPLYLTAGVFYVPFGALYTHFPDDPLIDAPLTLLLGESREKAVLGGLIYKGFSFSAYGYNGDVDKTGSDNHIASFGLDANYTFEATETIPLEFTVGASYISNIADSDGGTDALEVPELKDYVGGFDAYFHATYADFFFLAEYMTALDSFDPADPADEGLKGIQPAVWNVEFGYNWNWWRNLEICLNWAGSDDSGPLGFPKYRYGINFNQELYDGLIISLGYLYDEYDDNDSDDRDHRNTVFSQMAFEF